MLDKLWMLQVQVLSIIIFDSSFEKGIHYKFPLLKLHRKIYKFSYKSRESFVAIVL